MHRDADQAPASPAQTPTRSIVLLWLALCLFGWLVVVALGVAVYLAVTSLL